MLSNVELKLEESDSHEVTCPECESHTVDEVEAHSVYHCNQCGQDWYEAVWR